jgi:hypothetical protein
MNLQEQFEKETGWEIEQGYELMVWYRREIKTLSEYIQAFAEWNIEAKDKEVAERIKSLEESKEVLYLSSKALLAENVKQAEQIAELVDKAGNLAKNVRFELRKEVIEGMSKPMFLGTPAHIALPCKALEVLLSKHQTTNRRSKPMAKRRNT